MRRDLTPVLALAAAWWLWTDLTAAWGPSLITVLGQAGSTSAVLLGLFALACVALPFALVALLSIERTGNGITFRSVNGAGIALLAVALLARVVLAFVPGGSVQLWASSLGVAAALGWIALLAARHGRSLATGVASGWLITTALAAAGGTWLPIWRTDALGTVATVLLVGLALATCGAILKPTSPLTHRQAWTLFPLALVAGIAVVNPGRASTIITDTGPALLVVGCATAALSVAALGRAVTGWGRVAAGALAVVMVACSLWGTWAPGSGLPMELAWWLTPLLVAGPICLTVMLTPDLPHSTEPSTQSDVAADAAADEADEKLIAQVEAETEAAQARLTTRPRAIADLRPLQEAHDRLADREAAGWAQAATPFTVLQGALVWVVGFFLYYGGYDLGYRMDWLLPVVLAVVVYGVYRATPVPDRTGGPPLLLYPIALACLVAAGIGAYEYRQPVSSVPTADRDLRVVTWNVRMGYGLDGTFDPVAVGQRLRGADVVLLSEVDRGWLLNGGQDQLAILAHQTGQRLYFAPAADPVWGDAVLTNLPVTEVRNQPLASHGAPTGAQALAVKVRVDQDPIWMVSTHLQPHQSIVTEQAGEVAAFAASLASDGSAVVLAGDLNTEPGSEAFAALTAAGLTDALAENRPAATFSADQPTKQIDHVMVSGGLTVREAGVWDSRASDHLPVWGDLTLRAVS